jgi:hypothetical protein
MTSHIQKWFTLRSVGYMNTVHRLHSYSCPVWETSPFTEVIFQHLIALHRSDFGALCRLSATSLTILSLFSFIGHYMFRPNWTSTGVQVVMVKNSAAHSNVVLFLQLSLPLAFLVVWVTISFLGVLELHVVAFL